MLGPVGTRVELTAEQNVINAATASQSPPPTSRIHAWRPRRAVAMLTLYSSQRLSSASSFAFQQVPPAAPGLGEPASTVGPPRTINSLVLAVADFCED